MSLSIQCDAVSVTGVPGEFEFFTSSSDSESVRVP